MKRILFAANLSNILLLLVSPHNRNNETSSVSFHGSLTSMILLAVRIGTYARHAPNSFQGTHTSELKTPCFPKSQPLLKGVNVTLTNVCVPVRSLISTLS